MRLRHPREWRAAYASWSAGARTPTRTEARSYFVALTSAYVGFAGGAWWEPIGSVFVVGLLVSVYVAWWRLRTVGAAFTPRWERGVAERTGWPPALLLRAKDVLFAVALASVVASWLT